MKRETSTTCRRGFLRNTGRAAAASALAGVAIPHVHAAEDNTIQVALVGCGGRGSGAAADALRTKSKGPIKLVAFADIFKNRLRISHRHLTRRFEQQVDAPEGRRFLGFDAYRKAMDCLRPGDVVILGTPPAFRWVHFGYAIQKGLNVFMEKPTTVDGPTTKKMLALAEESAKKNLKVGVGLMVRHCRARRALYDRIQAGEIGEIISMRASRMVPAYLGFYGPTPVGQSELVYQTRRFHGFLWASGGLFSDLYIHQIDECCWMKDAWPAYAQANGGRNYRGDCVDQNFDHYTVEYVFPDGARMYLYGRCTNGCYREMNGHAFGSKGVGVIDSGGHHPGKCRIYRSQAMTKDDLTWAFPQPEPSPYACEWEDLIDAIRNDQPYNEAKRGAQASLVTSMGRMAAHTGQVITFEDMLNCPHEFAPEVDKLTMDSPAPLVADADGKYPIPHPGIVTDREYKG